MSTDEKAQLTARVRAPAYLVEIQLAAETTRVWSGSYTLSALGFSWLGTGDAGALEGLQSTGGLEAQSVSLSLRGAPTQLVDPSALKSLRTERYQGRPVKIYIAFFHIDTGALLFDPKVIYSGFIDTVSYNFGENVTVEASVDHYTSHLRRSNGLRMTTESHNARLGNPATRDLFFEQQSRLLGKPSQIL